MISGANRTGELRSWASCTGGSSIERAGQTAVPWSEPSGRIADFFGGGDDDDI
jgi:hypothetical protein